MLSDLPEIALSEGLRYVNDNEPGIRRRKRGTGFSYTHDDGSAASPTEVDRIKGIVIPPAWSDVWICRDDLGHIQATGRDAETRKQYRYHERWEELRDRVKFESLADFGAGLVRLRKAIDADLRRHEADLDRVSALAVAVLDRTLIRVGNTSSAARGSFGLTTLERKHVDPNGNRTTFDFVGKGGADRVLDLDDRRLSSHLGRIQDLPGQHLFDYQNDRGTFALRSEHINRYLLDRSGMPITAKDFRTWGASSMMVRLIMEDNPPRDDVLDQIDAVAEKLGNSREVARNAYIHPDIVTWYQDGELGEQWASSRASRWMGRGERTLLRCLAD